MEQLLNELVEVHQVVDGFFSRLKNYEKINIRIVVLLAANERTKETDFLHAKPSNGISIGCDRSSNFLECHSLRLCVLMVKITRPTILFRVRAGEVSAAAAGFAVGAARPADGEAGKLFGHLGAAAIGARMVDGGVGLFEKVADLAAALAFVFKDWHTRSLAFDFGLRE